jgi:PhnB protein
MPDDLAPPQTLSASQLCPYLAVRGAQEAIDFYVRAFGAKFDFKLVDPGDGRIGHAELCFGSTRLFIADEYPDFGAIGPERLGGSPVKLHLDVADADAFVEQAVREGATILRPTRLEFYGNRTALLADPFGYSWFISSKVEDVKPQEMQRRWDAMAESGA